MNVRKVNVIKHVATGMVLKGISTFTFIKVGYMKAVGGKDAPNNPTSFKNSWIQKLALNVSKI